MTGQNDYDENEAEQNDYSDHINSEVVGNIKHEPPEPKSEVNEAEVSLTEASIRLELAIENSDDGDVRREALRGFRHVVKALTMEQNGESNGG